MSIPPRIEQIKSMLEKEPEDAFLNYALATEYLAMNEVETAKNIFEKLVREQEEYVATYYHLGKLYEGIGQTKEAEETYEKGMQIALKIKDMHARSELQEALNNLLYDE